jgi:hypothetical protein
MEYFILPLPLFSTGYNSFLSCFGGAHINNLLEQGLLWIIWVKRYLCSAEFVIYQMSVTVRVSVYVPAGTSCPGGILP